MPESNSFKRMVSDWKSTYEQYMSVVNGIIKAAEETNDTDIWTKFTDIREKIKSHPLLNKLLNFDTRLTQGIETSSSMSIAARLAVAKRQGEKN
jgi:hypothetical protein